MSHFFSFVVKLKNLDQLSELFYLEERQYVLVKK